MATDQTAAPTTTSGIPTSPALAGFVEKRQGAIDAGAQVIEAMRMQNAVRKARTVVSNQRPTASGTAGIRQSSLADVRLSANEETFQAAVEDLAREILVLQEVGIAGLDLDLTNQRGYGDEVNVVQIGQLSAAMQSVEELFGISHLPGSDELDAYRRTPAYRMAVAATVAAQGVRNQEAIFMSNDPRDRLAATLATQFLDEAATGAKDLAAIEVDRGDRSRQALGEMLQYALRAQELEPDRTGVGRVYDVRRQLGVPNPLVPETGLAADKGLAL